MKKETLFVCCNLHCLQTEVLRLADKVHVLPGFQITRVNVSVGDEMSTDFVLAENLDDMRGKRYDTIKTCDRVTIGPGTASALYRYGSPE